MGSASYSSYQNSQYTWFGAWDRDKWCELVWGHDQYAES